MSDPRAIWQAAAGLSKQKTLRAIWPELAAALDGATGGDGSVPGEGEPQPFCAQCGHEHGALAVTKRADGTPICGYCVGRVPDSERRQLKRVPGWNAGRRHG